jgi:signal recognition particle subunit SRP54
MQKMMKKMKGGGMAKMMRQMQGRMPPGFGGMGGGPGGFPPGGGFPM